MIKLSELRTREDENCDIIKIKIEKKKPRRGLTSSEESTNHFTMLFSRRMHHPGPARFYCWTHGRFFEFVWRERTGMTQSSFTHFFMRESI